MNEDWDEALKLSIQKMLPLLTSIIWVALSYMPFDFLFKRLLGKIILLHFFERSACL